MTRLVVLLSVLLLPTTSGAFAQAKYKDHCEVIVADVQSGGVLKFVTFNPEVYEEELTNKTFRIPRTRLIVTASVFYTDESMASRHGADSVRLGLAISAKAWPSAFASPNNAVAELTSATFDTAQVYTTRFVTGRRLLILMECQQGARPEK